MKTITIRRASALLAATGLAISATLAGATPANAATVTKNDRVGDAPAHLDIHSVTYRNSKDAVSTRIRVPGLERRGQAHLTIGLAGTDFGYDAKVRIGRNNKLKKRVTFFTNTSSTKLDCKVSGKWSASKGIIVISVPQTCIELDNEPLYVRATTGKFRDLAPAVSRLRRGAVS